MKYSIIFIFLFILFIASCKNDQKEKTIRYKSYQDKIVNIKKNIIDIKPEILIAAPFMYIYNNILIIIDLQPHTNKAIHLFNKNTFEYITSTGIIGKGPGEIIRPGRIGINTKNKCFWVQDCGKEVIFKFPIDSVQNNNNYKPTKKLKLHHNLYISRYGFKNDSIALGKAIHVVNYHTIEMSMAKLNLNNNNIKKFGYEHPKTINKKSGSCFALSVENNFYVNCYYNCDLVTICDLHGNLKYNIYGPGWLRNKDNKNDYYSCVDIIGKNIIASYLGDVGIKFDKHKRPHGNPPSKLLIFDKFGNYKRTIETGYGIFYFCADKDNKRIIAYFIDKENPFGYFNLNLD
jgi:hypothetical protein